MGGDAIAFYNSGSDGEETLKENRFSSTRYRIRPRIMRGISHVDMTSSILGHSITFPVCVAPSAWHRFANLKGELETAKGVTIFHCRCYNAGVVMNLSSVATVRTEEVTSSFPDGLFFMQCYCLGNKRLQELMLREAKRQGFKAIVLSVDCSVISKRRKQFGPSMLERINSEMLPINYMQNEESSRRAEEEGPAAFLEYFMNMAHGATPVGLDFIRWIKDTSELPVITKGILTGRQPEKR
ncbi:putative hydroxyacid oxidase 1 [Apostichopus japonicus]|uniref:Putative hydroxyacid oxidase 1 n=1 Tax=Stichopus japonicus TaxID=307972 RepID=A0A2G8LAV4_STIJA|nr:putative hydroxyacid oxidase 1 [Apostichopus japonicus]